MATQEPCLSVAQIKAIKGHHSDSVVKMYLNKDPSKNCVNSKVDSISNNLDTETPSTEENIGTNPSPFQGRRRKKKVFEKWQL